MIEAYEQDKVNLKDLLLACSDGSGTIEQHKLVEHTFSKAINAQACPCGSKTTFGECCKLTWILFTRMKNRTKEAVKENNKEVRKENDLVRKDEKDIKWLLQVGISNEQDIVVKQLQKPGIVMSQASKILLNASHEMNIAATQQAINYACQNLIRQVAGEQPVPGIIKPRH